MAARPRHADRLTPDSPPVVASVPAALASRIADRAPRVLVLGDALLDGWLSGPARRLGRDGPVPVVELAESRSACGGAANTAANLAALGARSTCWPCSATTPRHASCVPCSTTPGSARTRA